jgi:hypothetical protein
VKYVRQFARFWYDFIVGDDWRLAAGAVTIVALVYFATHHGLDGWWFLPLGVAALLGVSVGVAPPSRRAARKRAR